MIYTVITKDWQQELYNGNDLYEALFIFEQKKAFQILARNSEQGQFYLVYNGSK